MKVSNIRELSPGKVYLEYGPISMVIAAWQQGYPLTELCYKGCEEVARYLKEISVQLTCLKKAWPLCPEHTLTGPAQLMWQAVRKTGDEDLTPMAAVAGVIADLTADWLVEQGATKVVVNNGGDIAVRLRQGEATKIGIVPYLGASQYSHTFRIIQSNGVGGIATSGLGGRSFTQGIVESVTVLAKTCSLADACATSLANASFIPSPKVKRVLAKTLDPNTDIPLLLVTVGVDSLGPEEIKRSLQQVEEQAKEQFNKGNIYAAVAHLQGQVMIYPKNFFLNKE